MDERLVHHPCGMAGLEVPYEMADQVDPCVKEGLEVPCVNQVHVPYGEEVQGVPCVKEVRGGQCMLEAAHVVPCVAGDQVDPCEEVASSEGEEDQGASYNEVEEGGVGRDLALASCGEAWDPSVLLLVH